MADPLITPRQIILECRKERGPEFETDAAKLHALFSDNGRAVQLAYNASVHMGDPFETNPRTENLLSRIVTAVATAYADPPIRRLKIGSDLVEPEDPRMAGYLEMLERAAFDSLCQEADELRVLLRQCVLVLGVSPEHGGLIARVYPPHLYYRMVNPLAADLIDQDKAITFLMYEGSREEQNVYQTYLQTEGRWFSYVSNIDGVRTAEPVLESAGLPCVLWTDKHLNGKSHLPIPTGRLDKQLRINALLADLDYLIKQEAHTITVFSTDDRDSVPNKSAPGAGIVLPSGATATTLGRSPKIIETIAAIDSAKSGLAADEALPPDYFDKNRSIITGPVEYLERDTNSKRQKLRELGERSEAQAYRKIAALRAAFGSILKTPALPEDAQLMVTWRKLRTWSQDQQNVAMRDLSIGALSIIGYIAQRDGVSHERAIDIYRHTQMEREAYPLGIDAQNPGAVAAQTDAPLAAGEGSATLKPGALNPDRAGASEGASVVSTARAANGA